jgi:hypothetical protein
VRGEEDHRQTGKARSQRLQQLETVHAGHAHVRDDELERARLQDLKRLFARRDVHGFEVALLEEPCEHLADGKVVLDDENARSLV